MDFDFDQDDLLIQFMVINQSSSVQKEYVQGIDGYKFWLDVESFSNEYGLVEISELSHSDANAVQILLSNQLNSLLSA